MDVQRESPLLRAHFHWRCAERQLCISSTADAVAHYLSVIRQLELVRTVSRDAQILSLLEKQIQFHKRRVSLLGMYSNEDAVADCSVSIEDISMAPADIEELDVSDLQEEPVVTPEEIRVPYKEMERDVSYAIPNETEDLADGAKENCTSLLARIEELENQNLTLKLDFEQERKKNLTLLRTIEELQIDSHNK